MPNEASEGGSEHSTDNLPFLKGPSDFLSENKCIHNYYLRRLQRRLGLDVLLRNGKLSTECSETPHRSESSSIILYSLAVPKVAQNKMEGWLQETVTINASRIGDQHFQSPIVVTEWSPEDLL